MDLCVPKGLNYSYVNCCIEFTVNIYIRMILWIIQFTQVWFYEQMIHWIAIIYIMFLWTIYFHHHRMFLHMKCTENHSAVFHERGPWMMFSGFLMQCSWKQNYSKSITFFFFCGIYCFVDIRVNYFSKCVERMHPVRSKSVCIMCWNLREETVLKKNKWHWFCGNEWFE